MLSQDQIRRFFETQFKKEPKVLNCSIFDRFLWKLNGFWMYELLFVQHQNNKLFREKGFFRKMDAERESYVFQFFSNVSEGWCRS